MGAGAGAGDGDRTMTGPEVVGPRGAAGLCIVDCSCATTAAIGGGLTGREEGDGATVGDISGTSDGTPAGTAAGALVVGAGVGTPTLGMGGRLATAPTEPCVPLMTPWKPAGKKPPLPTVLPIVAIWISCARSRVHRISTRAACSRMLAVLWQACWRSRRCLGQLPLWENKQQYTTGKGGLPDLRG